MQPHLRTALFAAVIAIAAGGLGYFVASRLESPPEPPPAPAMPVQPELRPVFSLSDVDGATRSITEWDGKALLINFWATWCPPCRREIPLLNRLQKTYGGQGLQIVGIALDTPEAVRDYQATTPLDYPSLVGELDAIEVGRKFGLDLYGLPISVLTDAQGRILAVHMGELSPDEATQLVERALGTAMSPNPPDGTAAR
jgi:thiol-disulfide isomerase/thioredoxin